MNLLEETLKRIEQCNVIALKTGYIESIQYSALEEIGELATELSIKNHWKQREPSEDGVLGECVDVFICLASVGLFLEEGFTEDLLYNIKVYNESRNQPYYPIRVSYIDCLQEIVKSIFDDGALLSNTCVTVIDIYMREGGTPETFVQRLNSKIEKWENNNVQSGN